MAKEPDQDNPFEKLKDVEYDANSAIAAFTKMGLEEVKWISTGIPSFDALTMIPRGRVTQIQAPFATGKTTLALNMVAGLRDKRVFYVDSEASLNPELLVALKLNPNNFTLYNKSAFLEDIYEEIKKAAESGMYDMIVFDSLAACTTKTEAEDNIANANIGQKAKMVNKMMRVLPVILSKNDVALVIINQEREVIGGYVPQKYTPGGMAVPYAASLMVSLKTMKSWRFGRTTKDTQAGNFIGHYIEAMIIKSKVNIPWRKSKFKLYYPQPRQESSDESDS
nr:MAG TPA: Protein recA [Caudoviricetes sp.]